MADIVSDFLTRDLSEPEWDALFARLEAQPEEAERLAAEMDSIYRSGPNPEPRRRALKFRLRWLGLLLAAGAAGLAAWAWMSPAPSAARPSLALPGEAFAVAQGPGPAAASPAAAKHGAAARYRTVGVNIEQAVDGDATVVVRDSGMAELRRLFQGRLARGKHRFEWDGDDASGKAVAEGSYFVEVRRASGTKRYAVKVGALE